MDHYYWSPSHGNDGTGAINDPTKPFATIQAMLDETATTPNATVFHMGNSAASNHSAELYWTNGLGSKWANARPCWFVPWDEGANGNLYRTVNGIEYPEWKLTVTADDLSLFVPAPAEYPAYCYLGGLTMDCAGYSRTGYAHVQTGGYSWMDGVRVLDSDGVYAITSTTGTVITNCSITQPETSATPTIGINGVNCTVRGCYVEGTEQVGIAGAYIIENCIAYDCGNTNAVYANMDVGLLSHRNNVVIGGTTNASYGFNFRSQSPQVVQNNLVIGLTDGFYIHSAYDNGFMQIGRNAFLDVDDHYKKDAVPTYGWDTFGYQDFTDEDITLDDFGFTTYDDIFVDFDNGDFRYTDAAAQILHGRGRTEHPSDFGGQFKVGSEVISGPSARTDIGLELSRNAGLPFRGNV